MNPINTSPSTNQYTYRVEHLRSASLGPCYGHVKYAESTRMSSVYFGNISFSDTDIASTKLYSKMMVIFFHVRNNRKQVTMSKRVKRRHAILRDVSVPLCIQKSFQISVAGRMDSLFENRAVMFTYVKL